MQAYLLFALCMSNGIPVAKQLLTATNAKESFSIVFGHSKMIPCVHALL